MVLLRTEFVKKVQNRLFKRTCQGGHEEEIWPLGTPYGTKIKGDKCDQGEPPRYVKDLLFGGVRRIKRHDNLDADEKKILCKGVRSGTGGGGTQRRAPRTTRACESGREGRIDRAGYL